MEQFRQAVVAVTLNVYSVGDRFESRPNTLAILTGGGLAFFSVSPDIRDSTSITTRPLPSSYFPIHHSSTSYVSHDAILV
jgi:hypothetical protein